jgi:hypothetical protein
MARLGLLYTADPEDGGGMHICDNNSLFLLLHYLSLFFWKSIIIFCFLPPPFSRPLLPFDFLVDVFAFLPLVKVDSAGVDRAYIFEGHLFAVTEASRLANRAASKTSRLR